MTITSRSETGKRSPARREARVPKDLLDSLIAHFNPRRVILFGSAARGEAGPDSDLDLVVVVDDDFPAKRLHWRSLYEARRGFPGAVDLLPCRDSVFRERADIVGSLPWIALTEGVVVYERADTG